MEPTGQIPTVPGLAAAASAPTPVEHLTPVAILGDHLRRSDTARREEQLPVGVATCGPITPTLVVFEIPIGGSIAQ